MKMLWDEMTAISPLPMCSCGGCTCNLIQKLLKAQQDQRLIQFLMELDEKFAVVRGNLLMMNPLPNITHAYSLPVQEEIHIELSSSSVQGESMVFTANNVKTQERFVNRGYKPAGFAPKPKVLLNEGENRPFNGNKRPNNYYC